MRALAVGSGERDARPRSGSPLPPPTPRWFRDGFLRYNHRLLGRNFAAVRVAGLGRLPVHAPAPVVVYLNHPAWWDPLVGATLVAAVARHRRHLALIDVNNLSGVLARLGFVGIEPGTVAGARRRARLGDALADTPDAMLWMPPQGRFADPRERPLALAGGLARLVRRVPGALAVPLAIEYPFLGGRRPEARLLVGEPLEGAVADERSLEGALEETMTRLAALVVDGGLDAFETLVGKEEGERKKASSASRATVGARS